VQEELHSILERNAEEAPGEIQEGASRSKEDSLREVKIFSERHKKFYIRNYFCYFMIINIFTGAAGKTVFEK
jgi:hypothetical protein